MSYPKLIQNLINQFAKLPSIGPKTAERLVFYLLYQPQKDLHDFGEAIEHLKENIKICSKCFNFAETNPCYICEDSRRDTSLLCVVAKPQDMAAIEKVKSFNGLYHILGGNISPIENIQPKSLKLQELIDRLTKEDISEVLIALNPDVPGETTTAYIQKILQKFPNIKTSRLARGLPVGADLEYADDATLESAINSRQEVI